MSALDKPEAKTTLQLPAGPSTQSPSTTKVEKKTEEKKEEKKPNVPIELLLATACKVEKVAVCVDGDVLHVVQGKNDLYLATRKKVNGGGRVHYTLREYAEKDRAIVHLGGPKTKST